LDSRNKEPIIQEYFQPLTSRTTEVEKPEMEEIEKSESSRGGKKKTQDMARYLDIE